MLVFTRPVGAEWHSRQFTGKKWFTTGKFRQVLPE